MRVVAVPDFTSALYLGLRHPSSSLRPWTHLSLGKPSALEPPPGATDVAAEVAALQGCEAGTLVPSTLHLFWDLFGILAREPVRIYLDSGTYPIARWGVERAAALGIPVHPFPHHDSAAARRMIERDISTGRRPVIVADGFCPGCGTAAPLARYLQCVAPYDGYLVIDDTQALGIFGVPRAGAPYGSGGGGSLRLQGIDSAKVILGSSLAKGFGAPVAALCGSKAVLRQFESCSETRVHASPPSVAVIHAAEQALSINSRCGDALRQQLMRRIHHFRGEIRTLGLRLAGGIFPVQTLASDAALDITELHRRLLVAGVRTVLHRDRIRRTTRLSFLITAGHRLEEIEHAVAALQAAVRFNRVRAFS
jgi:8-amino-7-oxononanoate synthase